VTAELKRYFGEKLCATTIPRNIRLAEAPSHGKPALVYDVKSRGAESYIRLAKEIITHYMESGAPAEAVTQVPAAEGVEAAGDTPAEAVPVEAGPVDGAASVGEETAAEEAGAGEEAAVAEMDKSA